MEIKKTDKASLKGNNILYLLAGLNIILLVVWGLFSYKTAPEKVEIVEAPPIVESSDVILIEIPEPEIPPPPPPPDEAPPPPPPPPVPEEIEQTPEPVPPPPIQEQKHTPPPIPTTPTTTAPPKRDLSHLQNRAEEVKDQRTVEPVTVNRVQNMAVYPGCEKHKGDKRALITCFGDQLSRDILRYLDTEFPNVNKERVAVQLEFHVSTEGEIVNVYPKAGDDIFKPEAKRALERAAQYLKQRGRKIEPATMANGDKATLIFQNNVVLQNPDY